MSTISHPHAKLCLVLDLGGVIVDHDNAQSFDRLAELLEEKPTRDEIATFISASGIGTGELTANDLFGSLKERYGSAASHDQFLDAWTCHFSLKQDVYELLNAMKAERAIVLCSNTNGGHWDYLNRRYELDKLAMKAILSHECGCEKPDPEIYLLAAAAHNRTPQECLFVDDLKTNIDGAKSLGFHTHHFTSYENFAQIIQRG